MTERRIRRIEIDQLANRAKVLVEGMQYRTGRNPDIADFKAAFLDELEAVPEATEGDTD